MSVETTLTPAPMTEDDLDQVLAIERVSFVTPWTRAAFCYEIEQNKVARCTAMRVGGRVVGYLCLWEIGHEIHITNLAVHPEWRRRGVGRRLLAFAMAEGKARGVTLAFLEVRPSNAQAVKLYESLQFQVIGRRTGYYFDTGEDALVMEARLDGDATPTTAGNRQAGS
ncbi:MAG TPA: ribosomal protein S18-alanine N-acetyltransferase [Candidatus Bathyarchaeia archaeon]|nr:ribosomal protein S18-alanine N-acetyltransferase [Candidatus Bathyarchaeia archaeon]